MTAVAHVQAPPTTTAAAATPSSLPWLAHESDDDEGSEDDDGADDNGDFDDDPEVAYLLRGEGGQGLGAAAGSEARPVDVILADRIRVVRHEGKWRVRLGSGCARLGGREHRVLDWALAVDVDF